MHLGEVQLSGPTNVEFPLPPPLKLKHRPPAPKASVLQMIGAVFLIYGLVPEIKKDKKLFKIIKKLCNTIIWYFLPEEYCK